MSDPERPAAVTAWKSDRPAAKTELLAALYETGIGHMRAGRHLEAQLCCQQALGVDSNHADTLFLQGLLSFYAAQYDLAIAWTARAIKQDPKPEYLLSLAAALRRQGRLDEAFEAIDKAVQLRPDAAGLWKQLGHILVDLNRPDQALLSFEHALRLDPRDADAAAQCGAILAQQARPEQALPYFALSDRLQPNCAATLQRRAMALCDLGRFDAAAAEIERAHALDPANAEICANVGFVIQRLGRREEALAWCDRALELQPDHAFAFLSKASVLAELRRFDEALAVYDALKAVDPGNADAEWNSALLQLLIGNFEAGWAGREARSRVPGLSIARFEFPRPVWLGTEAIDGKTVLIHVDEGLGDTLQFVRYVPMVAALGARVLLVVPDALQPLLSKLPGVSECFSLSVEKRMAFDMYTPLSSLPLAFRTTLATVPSDVPYLPAPAACRVQAWEDRLGQHDRLRVGLTWAGNPKHGNDHNRSLPLRKLLPLLDCDAHFVSLQKEPRSEDRPILSERPDLVDLTVHLTDFVETTALMSCLDLIITVDTSIAHLAGALGRPTWILLPYTPDFRWLLDRDDSPWYPTARLFRQDEARDYAGVITRIREELMTRIAAWQRQNPSSKMRSAVSATITPGDSAGGISPHP
jgi:tetratricopeptide (TPR) repeat protein